MSKEIWLIRHGESTANAGLATKDASSIALTDKGWHQAREMAEKFSAAPDLIVVSPYLRARQTAGPTAERFADTPIETWPVQEFTYLSPVRCANTTVEQRRPLVDAYWKACDPSLIDGPGAESFAQMLDRVREAARRIEASPARTMAIFTHGHIMQAWRLLANNPAASDKTDMERFLTAFQARPIENCEWLSGAAYEKVARS
ncbi:histidine phosphatase family protein [Labrys okinawensis]|uniref:histidine phosphatase family protein n=1 Tax=Labrys okinawensis TaxID=346911 RepID=UPI0039BC8E7A